MFENLQDKLQAALGEVRSRGKLDEADVAKAMRQVRLALLEADVNYDVVVQFTEDVKQRCLGAEVVESVNPGQQVVKIVADELTALMGTESSDLAISDKPPTVTLMAGLQGSGKTSACAKLAVHLKGKGAKPALAACDIYRPAAIDQLLQLGERAGIPVYEQGTERDPVDIAGWALGQAERAGCDHLIVDTAGRLHIDHKLMEELKQVRKRVKPGNVLLVLDAMTGQDAVNVAQQFAKAVEFDGVVMTKLDGDARGGAALSVKGVTGRPVKFISTGEGLDSFERFHPDRMASRILGMGDVVSLVEKAKQQVDEKQAHEMERKILKASFTFDDFLKQMKMVRRMGPMTSLLGMMPGMAASKELRSLKIDERELDRIEAIVTSMTVEERVRPDVIDGSRRRRIAAGSGTSVQAVNQLVKQFGNMKKMMKQLSKGNVPGLQQMLGGQ